MRCKRILGPGGKANCYWIWSRTIELRNILGTQEKERLMALIWQHARFSGVDVLAFALVGGRFEILVRVPDKERADRKMTDGMLAERVAGLYDKKAAARYLKELAGPDKDAARSRLLARMHDLGMFVKGVKQRTTQWFNTKRGRVGTLWDQPFQSVLVDSRDTALLDEVAATVVGLPVRWEVCRHYADYRWCWRAKEMGARRGMPPAWDDFIRDLKGWCEVAMRARDPRVVPVALASGALVIGGAHFVRAAARRIGRGAVVAGVKCATLRSG